MARIKLDGHVWNSHKIDGSKVVCIQFASGADDAISCGSGSVNFRTEEFNVGDTVRMVLEVTK